MTPKKYLSKVPTSINEEGNDGLAKFNKRKGTIGHTMGCWTFPLKLSSDRPFKTK